MYASEYHAFNKLANVLIKPSEIHQTNENKRNILFHPRRGKMDRVT